jgi:hypothetical protein
MIVYALEMAKAGLKRKAGAIVDQVGYPRVKNRKFCSIFDPGVTPLIHNSSEKHFLCLNKFRLQPENALSTEHTNISDSSSSGHESRMSVTSDPVQEVYNLLPPPPPPRPPKAASHDYISMHFDTQVMHNDQKYSYDGFDKVKTVSVLLTMCVEHIAFVEVGSKVW